MGVRFQIVRIGLKTRTERPFRVCREVERCENSSTWDNRINSCSLLLKGLQDCMGVSATKAKAIHTGTARRLCWDLWPFSGHVQYLQIIIERLHSWIEFIQK